MQRTINLILSATLALACASAVAEGRPAGGRPAGARPLPKRLTNMTNMTLPRRKPRHRPENRRIPLPAKANGRGGSGPNTRCLRR